MSDLAHALEEMRRDRTLARHITHWRTIPAQPADLREIPPELDAHLTRLLAAQGIERLYSHQADAVRRILEGQEVAIVTPTASGKTLCYNLPVLDALLHDPAACALYLFPTKALAHDQLHTLHSSIGVLGEDIIAAAYDGDTPSAARTLARREARVLVTNPDMLHAGILPDHARWQRFFAHLRYVVLDEMHVYRGIFGSHVANVLRRLARVARFHGSRPQFVGCSATIANPAEQAEKLIGRTVSVITHNGAPQGQRSLVFYNPPIMDAYLGIRRSALVDAQALASRLLEHGIQTAVFCRSRLATELLLSALRRQVRRSGHAPTAIRGYRSGYLPSERRHVEQGLREGTVRGVVATNALELGVDIGELSACIMAGYPGTIASTWQQAGRAGRGRTDSLGVLVASASPLDQYIIAHPDYFFGQSPEHALLNPDNLHILLSHIRCAAFELPLEDGESFGGEDLQEMLRFLESTGSMRRLRDKWQYAGSGNPAHEVSLRTADARGVTITELEERDVPAPTPKVRQRAGPQEAHPGAAPRGRTIGHTDRASAPTMLYEGAIYLHDGQQYLVETLDWDGGMALVRPVSVDYYTEAAASTRITIERIIEERHWPNMDLALGEVTCTSRVSSYRRVRTGTGEHLGWGAVNLPEQEMLTSASWLTIPEAVLERLRAEGQWVGEHIPSRGASWAAQRDLARRRDHYRCRWCGAPERDGRQHDVHHVVPYREFRERPGMSNAQGTRIRDAPSTRILFDHLRANQLDNLITLCPNCHRRAEQQVAVLSTLSGLARVLHTVVPLLLMCDPGDVGMVCEIKARQTGLPTLFVYDQVPGGIGLSEQVLPLIQELLARAAELVRDCPCASGCPSCIGPTTETDGPAKQRVLRLLSVLQELPHD